MSALNVLSSFCRHAGRRRRSASSRYDVYTTQPSAHSRSATTEPRAPAPPETNAILSVSGIGIVHRFTVLCHARVYEFRELDECNEDKQRTKGSNDGRPCRKIKLHRTVDSQE